MKKIIPAMIVVWALVAGGGVSAQDKVPKVAIMSIQMAIAQSQEGQEAAKTIQTRFAPKRAELEKQQKEIADLQNQLTNQARTLSEDARNRLQRQIDDKTRVFNRTNEDATTEFQQAEADAINEIGRKMMQVISDYAQKNGYTVVLDVSSPQTPILYADTGMDITPKIIELYDQANTKPAASSAPGSAPKPAAGAARPAAGAAAKPAEASSPPKADSPAANP